jgi:hypothetical protein
MAQGCCGFFAFVFFIVIFYFAVKVISASHKESKMRKTHTTSLRKLIDMREELKKRSQYLELKGRVNCDNPLRTPLTGRECVLYDFTVTQYWTTPCGDDDTDHKKVVHKSRGISICELSDDTETVPIVFEKNINIDIDMEYEKEFHAVQFIKGVPITYVTTPSNATDISYEYLENYLSVDQYIYFIGNVRYDGEKFILQPGGSVSFITDKDERKVVQQVRVQRSADIRWIFLATVCFALAFVGYYGKPEGLAETLRGTVDFIIAVLEEVD